MFQVFLAHMIFMEAQKRRDEHFSNFCEIHTKCSTCESSAECVDDQRAYVEYLEMML